MGRLVGSDLEFIPTSFYVTTIRHQYIIQLSLWINFITMPSQP
jgi:hypothetical protein